MDNSTLTMTKTTSEGKNIIQIDPSTGLLFTKNGKEVVKLNIQDGSATFGGTIDTRESVKVGETIVVRDSRGGDGLVISAKGGTIKEAITITANNGRYIDITSNLVRINGDGVSTKSDLDALEDSIKDWANGKFAVKGSTNPTIPIV